MREVALGVTTAATIAVGNLVGEGRGDRLDAAAPSAANRAPTADQARLPSSTMPTMPTIMATSRARDESSGGAPRAMRDHPSSRVRGRRLVPRYSLHTVS